MDNALRPTAVHRLAPAPARVAGDEGQPLIGTYQGAPDRVDLSNFKGDYKPRLLDRFLRNKRWTFTSVTGRNEQGESMKMTMAVIDLGYASSGFVSVYNLDKNQTLAQRNFTDLPGRARVSAEPVDGLSATFDGLLSGAQLSVTHPENASRYRQHVSIPARGSHQSVEFDGVFSSEDAPPATVISPVVRPGDAEPSAVSVTVKSHELSGSAVLRVGGQTFNLHDTETSVDYTSGTMKRVTEWRWASTHGRLEDGRSFGLNLVEGLNETDPRANENLLWSQAADGEWEVVPLPRVRFEYDRANPLAPWRVSSMPGSRYEISLDFEPKLGHENKTNLGIIRSNYVQPTGTWSGRITDTESGESFVLRGADGVAEDQRVKW